MRHDPRTSSADVYKFPPYLAYFAALAGILLAGLAWLPGATAELSKSTFLLYLSPGLALAAAVTLYVLRYKVTVTGEAIEICGLWNRRIPLSQVVDTDLRVGQTRELVAYLQDGRRVRFSGLLKGFDSLAGKVSGRALGRGMLHADSLLKLTDRARGDAAGRRSLWLVAGGAILLVSLLLAERVLER